MGGLHCSAVCLSKVTHRKRHNWHKSKKKKNLKNAREKERWVAAIVQLCVCLSKVTHRKRHNWHKSKKKKEFKKCKREREVGGLHCSAVCLSV